MTQYLNPRHSGFDAQGRTAADCPFLSKAGAKGWAGREVERQNLWICRGPRAVSQSVPCALALGPGEGAPSRVPYRDSCRRTLGQECSPARRRAGKTALALGTDVKEGGASGAALGRRGRWAGPGWTRPLAAAPPLIRFEEASHSAFEASGGGGRRWTRPLPVSRL
ncbi:uncharacterized protein LOC110744157 [Papio anubis]|uniref:uncharacterized protein LOC110744157 n=1 Tax=Papio anubis TaxID=9555 RepID=UPI000B7AFC2A|nr:uncharacterized protein LOC110744157 [Papio anubis]